MTAATRGPGLSFSHMGFYVKDLPTMEAFYRRVVGFTVTDRGHLPTSRGPVDLVFLSRDPEEHHQIVLASGRPEDLPFNVINQISFRLSGIAELRSLYERVRAEPNVTEVLPVTHGNAISVYFRDPEGNRLEIFFDTAWYCTQPMREPVDFTLSDEQIIEQSDRIAHSAPTCVPRGEWVADMRRRMEAGIHA